MRGLRLTILLLLTVTVAVSIFFFQDPWLWRRVAGTVIYAAGDQPRILAPNEPVSGGGLFVLPRATPEERTIDDLAIKAIEDYAAGFDSDALIVVHQGKIQVEWYADGLDRNTLTQSQSMHKSLLALLIGVAIEEGIIDSADDPVGKYIEEWQSHPRGDITLRELMMMSSGLAQYEFTLNPFTDDFRWLYSGDTLRYVLKTPMADWDPGTQFDYNNINSELLGVVLERASGMRYADYLEKKLWNPMGGDQALVWLDSEFGDAFTSCCLMATATDWARIGQMMLQRGEINGNRIVADDWIEAMIRPSPVSKWYGLQTWLAYEIEVNPRSQKSSAMGAYSRKEPFLARDVYYFSGRGAQRVYIVPSRDLVIVRLGPALGRNPLKGGWDNAFLINSVISGMK
jgi:CubicO group peptidase (beta-lactamase class C family)